MGIRSQDPFRHVALLLGLLVGLVTVLLPLLPEAVRPYNYAAFGALGLFVSARVGFQWACLIGLGGKFVSDLLNYLIAHPGSPEYMPIWYIVASFAIYPLFGLLLKRNLGPLRIGVTAFGASVAFFLITNFASWLRQDLPYGYTLMGLFNCYVQGVEFYRGTLLGDLTFTAALFVAHAVLTRSSVSIEEPITIPVDRS